MPFDVTTVTRRRRFGDGAQVLEAILVVPPAADEVLLVSPADVPSTFTRPAWPAGSAGVTVLETFELQGVRDGALHYVRTAAAPLDATCPGCSASLQPVRFGRDGGYVLGCRGRVGGEGCTYTARLFWTRAG